MVMSEVVQNYIIGGLVLSLVINFFLILWFGFSGIGKDAWRRFRQKKLYRKGGYAYSLMLTKEGLIQEIFAKVSEGAFKIGGKSYIRNPRLTKPFRGIPAHIHLEDVPAPIDPWNQEQNNSLLSCGELDTVLTSQASFDIKEWVQSIIPYMLIAMGVMIVILIVVIFFSYSNYQTLKTAGSTVIEAVIPVA